MKHSEIYRAAAKQVSEKTPLAGHNKWHYPCCSAIDRVRESVAGGSLSVKTDFASYFKPRGRSFYAVWFGIITDDKNRDIRVLALLFMAAIAESEGN